MGSLAPTHKRERKIVNVGLIGCGSVAQVVHLPTLNFLSDSFKVVYLCDVSRQALEHCKGKVVGGSSPKTTTQPAELCASPDVDVVFVTNSDEYHATHAILALEHDKFVFVEKPLALNMRDIDKIKAAERTSKGSVMVGYMRRYAEAFLDGVKEIGGIDKILYARVRGWWFRPYVGELVDTVADIIGPNSTFIDQSGTFSKVFSDVDVADEEDRESRATEHVAQGLKVECGVPVNDTSARMWRVLGSLGTHDLSAMREALGLPTKVLGSYLGFPFWK